MTEMKGKSIIIFGCGYLGSALARRAIDDGMSVAALTRNRETANGLRDLGVNPVIEDELDATTWHDKLNPRQDFVINCVSSGGRGLEAYYKSYVQGQSSIITWANEGRVGTYVFTSSTSVYPPSRGNWVDETNTNDGASEQGKVLLDAERLLTDKSKVIERYFILRLAGIYGPGRHHLLDQLRNNFIRTEDLVERHLNIIHRDDIRSALYACLFAPEEMRDQIFNVVDNYPVRKKNLLCWLGDQLGIPLSSNQAIDDHPAQGGESSRWRGLADRKISNKKIKTMLGWSPAYPSYKEGYQNILY